VLYELILIKVRDCFVFNKTEVMETLDAIFTRRSIRKYKNKEIPGEILENILKAGMFAPSARNEQPWHFLVVTDRELLDRLMKAHPYASMLAEAPMAILVCADTDLEKSKGYWPVDCSAATQNIRLAAHTGGLGSVWLGVYPRTERMEAISTIFSLRSNIQPFALIALGYPAEEKETPDRFRQERIHHNDW
jgi:nitroreductase